MLSMDLGVTMPFSTVKQSLCSFVDKHWFFTFENDVGSMYYSKQEMALAGFWGFKDFCDRGWFERYKTSCVGFYAQTSTFLQKNTLRVMQEAGTDSLYQIAREAGLLLANIYGYFNASQPQCMRLVEEELQKELEKTLPSEQRQQAFLDLATSRQGNFLTEEEDAWHALCRQRLQDEALENAFQAHAERYGILGTADGGVYYDVPFYKQRYNASAESAPASPALEREVRTSEYGRQLADVLATTGHLRLELRLRGFMPLDYWFRQILLPVLEHRFGIPVALSRQFTFQELLDCLLTKSYPKTEIAKRVDYFLVSVHAGRISIQGGVVGRKKAQKLLPKAPARSATLRGQVAHVGDVQGSAYVLSWNETDLSTSMDVMPRGSILVVGQTRPQLMLAIKKAAAIVTDEGGITSHAAIVARELGIPCIIGTRVATKMIVTGDTIRVDAYTGTVHIYS